MRILSIFNKYRYYGGEETMMNRIDSALSKAAYSQAFVYSTRELLGNSLVGKCLAPFKSLHNGEVAKQLEELQKEHSFDAWLVHNVFPGLSPSVFSTAFKLGVPVIFMVHNYRLGCINGFFLRDGHLCDLCPTRGYFQGIKYRCWHHSFLLSSYNTLFQSSTRATGLFEKAASFIALSNAQVPYLKQIGIPEEKTTVIPHFVDIPDTFSLPKGDGDVLFMGRLSREKNAHLVIEAWEKLAPQNRRLVIAGTGPEEDNLKNYVAKRKIANVEFAGFVSGQAQQDLWERSSFYIMPSSWPETAAMTILEAWSHARPALAFNIGAAVDYLQDGRFGWLADMNAPDDLANVLKQALETPEAQLQAMGESARKHVETHHSEEVWVSQFSDLVKSIT